MSIRKDKKTNTWFYVLEMGKDDNGKRKQQFRRGFKTKKEAEEAYNKVKYEMKSGTYLDASKMLYKDFLDDWLSTKQHSLEAHTIEIYKGYIKNYLIPELGNIPLAKLSAIHIERFISVLKSKGLAHSTIERIYSVLNTSLNNAYKKEMVIKNVASLIDKPKVPKNELIVWDVDQAQAFLKTVQQSDSRFYVAFHLAIMTGMRQGEILGLRWSDIDFDNQNLVVCQTLSHNGKSFKQGGKTKSSTRSIAIDEKTTLVLKKHRTRILSEKLNVGEHYKDLNLVVCTSKGTPVTPRNLSRTWYTFLKKADLPQIRFHDLRHTHASLLLKIGQHPKVVQERLGHSTIKMTLDTYSHLLPNMQEDAAKELGKLIL